MSIINYAKKEISFKIVYYGAGVVGKTVNLQYIHRSLPDDNRGNLISLATGDERTLFFDFLPVSTHSVRNFVAKFQLYTVPGQVYYNMTRKLVLRGSTASCSSPIPSGTGSRRTWRASRTSRKISASTTTISPSCPT